ncbi:hypothetical protein HMPREF1980_01749 [Actinomyces sp. oral taxon 172 str. F0311]|nr:hypothetical protein HMPREF1980_01749 [Actinomyces sp. oral taxon 172 str. F0311]
MVLTWNNAIFYPQPYQQLCINRMDGCFTNAVKNLKTDLGNIRLRASFA